MTARRGQNVKCLFTAETRPRLSGDETRDMRAKGVERDVLHAFSVMIRLKRGADRVWRSEEIPIDSEAFRLGVDSGLCLDWEHVLLALDDELYLRTAV